LILSFTFTHLLLIQKMSELSREQKRFIVVQLACFKSPSEVVELVKEEFNIEISRQAVRHYNPLQSEDCAEEWRVLFKEVRESYTASLAEVGVYHLRYRLDELQELIRRAKGQGKGGNLTLIAQLIEQAAKETSGFYSNSKGSADGSSDQSAASVVKTILEHYSGQFSSDPTKESFIS
jgi:hypothetical protein